MVDKRKSEGGKPWVKRAKVTGAPAGNFPVKGSIKPRNKLVITYDEAKQADYLTGFHKRKIERQKNAAQEQDFKAKEEKRKKRQEIKNKLTELRALTGADNQFGGFDEENEEEAPQDGEITKYEDEDNETVTTVVTTVVTPLELGAEVKEDNDDDFGVGLDKDDIQRKEKILLTKEAIRSLKQDVGVLTNKKITFANKYSKAFKGQVKNTKSGKHGKGHDFKSHRRPGAAPEKVAPTMKGKKERRKAKR